MWSREIIAAGLREAAPTLWVGFSMGVSLTIASLIAYQRGLHSGLNKRTEAQRAELMQARSNTISAEERLDAERRVSAHQSVVIQQLLEALGMRPKQLERQQEVKRVQLRIPQ
jgi:hypothetical protein